MSTQKVLFLEKIKHVKMNISSTVEHKSTDINIRIEPTLKIAFKEWCKEKGVTVSKALTIYIKNTVTNNKNN